MGARGTGVSRRDFLRVGGLSVVGLSLAEQRVQARVRKQAGRRSCIFLLMTGGPSQLETFDPKPEAPAAIRGPLQAIPTSIPGTLLSESLPRLAERAHKFTLLRSLSHDAAPIHETGYQLLQTGRLARRELRYPAFGSVIARELGPRDGIAPYIVLPRLLRQTGVETWRGQQAGLLGEDFNPLTVSSVDDASEQHRAYPDGFLAEEPEAVRRAYGDTHFGRLCLQARKLVECGVRCVTVNLFDRLNGEPTWDCHGRSTPSGGDVHHYRDHLCPQFDRAVAALLDDLQQRGLFDHTLVVATGEFGRTPHLNADAGRDHWPACWSGLIAGAGIPGGAVIAESDATASRPSDRPIAPAELVATVYERLGVDPAAPLCVDDSDGMPACDSFAISELIA